MNIRRFLMFIFSVIVIVGTTVIIFFIESCRPKNVESVQTINGVKLERSFQGDEPIPVNESPEEYQKRLYREGEAELRKIIDGMSSLEAAKFLYLNGAPPHKDLFFEKINKAIKENPTFEALMLRGRFHQSFTEDTEFARKDFARAVKINPQSYEAHQELARILCSSGKYDDSIVEAKKAIELGSKDGYSIMGQDYFSKGDLKESLKYYQEFDKCIPNTPAVGTIEFLKSKIAELEKQKR